MQTCNISAFLTTFAKSLLLSELSKQKSEKQLGKNLKPLKGKCLSF